MSEVKARKQHTCSLCFEPIYPGTIYHYEKITPWDHVENDAFFSFKAHLDCHKKWLKLGHHFDWEFPPSRMEWDELINDEG